MNSAALLLSNEEKFNLLRQIQTSQTRGQPYSDTFHMVNVLCFYVSQQVDAGTIPHLIFMPFHRYFHFVATFQKGNFQLKDFGPR